MWCAVFACTLSAGAANPAAKPLQVFILAGQSNMQGHAEIGTFDYIGDDPDAAPLLAQMRGPDGRPRVLDHVWISSVGCAGDGHSDVIEQHGRLTAGFGASPSKIGPEFTFGLTVDAALDEPVLIIKTAWGGRSLHTDFRPPSGGPYALNDFQRTLYYGPPGHGVPEDMDQWLTAKEDDTGRYYRLMVEHVQQVLRDPKRVCPAYDPAAGYEIAGFVWLQGFNDLVDHHTYPESDAGDRFALYSRLLEHFIRDVRKDLNAPQMPFVIGVLGVGGLSANQATVAFRQAMAAPAAQPEFRGNVVAVETAPFWSAELAAIDDKRDQVRQMSYFLNSQHQDHANADGRMTEQQKREYLEQYEATLISPAEAALWQRGASNGGYHYLGCAKTFALMGRSFAEALLNLRQAPLQSTP
jgi:alpha-galactosidase